MKIKIINPCMELQRAGIKPGGEVDAIPGQGSDKTGSLFFEVKNGTRKFECVVWPDNYEVVDEEGNKIFK